MQQQNSFEISFEGSLDVVQQVADWLSSPKQSPADEGRWNTWAIGKKGYKIHKSEKANRSGKYTWQFCLLMAVPMTRMRSLHFESVFGA